MHGNNRPRRRAHQALAQPATAYSTRQRIPAQSLTIRWTVAASITVHVRMAMVAAACTLGMIASQVAPASASSEFGPGDPRWQAYYSAPGDVNTWNPFCHAGGGSWLV